MTNPEQYDPEKQAREVIESLSDTPEGKYFEKEPTPEADTLTESGFSRKEAADYMKTLNKDLVGHMVKHASSGEDREFIERGILKGAYGDILLKLKEDMDSTENTEVHNNLSNLVERIESPWFQVALRALHQEASSKVSKLLDKKEKGE